MTAMRRIMEVDADEAGGLEGLRIFVMMCFYGGAVEVQKPRLVSMYPKLRLAFVVY